MKCPFLLLITCGLAMPSPFEIGTKIPDEQGPSNGSTETAAIEQGLVNDFNIQGNQNIGVNYNVGQQGKYGHSGNQGGQGKYKGGQGKYKGGQGKYKGGQGGYKGGQGKYQGGQGKYKGGQGKYKGGQGKYKGGQGGYQGGQGKYKGGQGGYQGGQGKYKGGQGKYKGGQGKYKGGQGGYQGGQGKYKGGQGGFQGGGCHDTVSSCPALAKQGLCPSLQNVCCQSCSCKDAVSSCPALAKQGLCSSLQSICCQSCVNPSVIPSVTQTSIPAVTPTLPGNKNIGQTKHNAAKSCKEIKDKRPNAGSGVYWIKPDGTNPIQAYCDQQTDGGGWTLVFSYTFTNYRYFRSGRNAITPRPNWPIDYDSGNINPSTTPPQSETDYNAMDFNLWKNLGHEFMVKSNINHWIACKEGSGSLVEFRIGSLQCRNIKNVASKCQNYVPDELILHTAGNPRGKTLGPELIRSQSWAWLKEYYYFEANTRTNNWPTHDPCGKNSLNHLKNVANPHGNIYIRE